jgi:hypothetical protein
MPRGSCEDGIGEIKPARHLLAAPHQIDEADFLALFSAAGGEMSMVVSPAGLEFNTPVNRQANPSSCIAPLPS